MRTLARAVARTIATGEYSLEKRDGKVYVSLELNTLEFFASMEGATIKTSTIEKNGGLVYSNRVLIPLKKTIKLLEKGDDDVCMVALEILREQAGISKS